MKKFIIVSVLTFGLIGASSLFDTKIIKTAEMPTQHSLKPIKLAEMPTQHSLKPIKLVEMPTQHSISLVYFA